MLEELPQAIKLPHLKSHRNGKDSLQLQDLGYEI